MKFSNSVAAFRFFLPIAAGLAVITTVVVFAMSRVENAKAPLKAIEVALSDSGIEAESTEAKVALLAQTHKAIEKTLEASGVEGITLAIRVDALAADRARLSKDLAVAQKRIEELETAIAAGEVSEQRLTFLASENKDLGLELDTTRDELQNLRAQLEAARGDFSTAETEKSRVEGELAQLHGVLQSAGAEQGEFESWIAGLNGKLKGLNEENERLAVENARFVSEAEETKIRLATVESEAMTLKEESRSLEAQIATAKRASAPLNSFTVYFGFDNADLTPRGRAELARAASSAKSLGARSIAVTGYADRFGNKRYNMRLSAARADAVIGTLRQELDKRGAKDVAIRRNAKGESGLPVSTPDQTREEENRRVDIRLE